MTKDLRDQTDPLSESPDWQKIAEVCSEVVRVNPNDDEAWFRLGDAYQHLEKRAEAFDAFLKLFSLNPMHEYAGVCLVMAFRDVGATDVAIATMERIASQPQSRFCSLLLPELGCAYIKRGEIQKALHAYHRAVREWPNDADSWISLGELYLLTEQTDEAITAFQQAVDLNPETSDPWEKLVELFERSSPIGQEIYEVLRIPKDSIGWRYMAFVYRNLKLTEKEIYTLKKSLRSSPNDDFSWELLDRAYRRLVK